MPIRVLAPISPGACGTEIVDGCRWTAACAAHRIEKAAEAVRHDGLLQGGTGLCTEVGDRVGHASRGHRRRRAGGVGGFARTGVNLSLRSLWSGRTGAGHALGDAAGRWFRSTGNPDPRDGVVADVRGHRRRTARRRKLTASRSSACLPGAANDRHRLAHAGASHGVVWRSARSHGACQRIRIAPEVAALGRALRFASELVAGKHVLPGLVVDGDHRPRAHWQPGWAPRAGYGSYNRPSARAASASRRSSVARRCDVDFASARYAASYTLSRCFRASSAQVLLVDRSCRPTARPRSESARPAQRL